MMHPLKIMKKVALIGDAAVGKTSLVRKFVLDEFDDKYIATIGLKVTKKSLIVPYGKESVELIIMIWDLLGQKGFQRSQERAFRGVDAAICVADVTRPETLKSVEEYWVPMILRTTGPIPLIFFANKIDLEDQVKFGMREILALEQKFKMKDATGSHPQSFLTSARTGAGVEEGFKSIGHYLLFTEPAMRDDRIVITDPENYSFTSLSEALDAITIDFINRFFYEIAASKFLQDCAAKVMLDITNPTIDGLQAFVNELADTEKRANRPEQLISKNLERRRKMIDSVPKFDSIKQ
jgi:small GTP-binding protein